MADYVKVFETTDYDDANKYIKNGWVLIDTPKKSTFGEAGYTSYTKYTLGLSAKEHANRLLAIIREYEKYGLKETLLEKVAEEMGDNISEYEPAGFVSKETPLARYMSNYENVVNNEKILYSNQLKKYNESTYKFTKENPDDLPF